MNQSRKLRILLVNDHLGWGSQIHGVARLFQLWASHLDTARFQVMICILSPRDSQPALVPGAAPDPSGSPDSPDSPDSPCTVHLERSRYNPLLLPDLVRLIRREHIDVLHLQGYRGTALGKLAGMLTGIPVVVHYHDTADYYPLVQRLSDLLLGRRGQVHLAVSESARRCWAQRCGLSPERIQVLYNCVDTAAFTRVPAGRVQGMRRQLGIAPGAPVVGSVTRLFPGKGTRYLLDAAAAVLKRRPGTVFVIVGDGPLRADLEAQARRLGIQGQVVFTGFAQEVAPLLALFDLMVLTSYREGGSPLPVLEAMAMGLAVIVTDEVEIIEPDTTGVVIPARDPALLADSISTLLAHPEQARRLGANARVAACAFDVRGYVQSLGGIYGGLVQHGEVAA